MLGGVPFEVVIYRMGDKYEMSADLRLRRGVFDG